MSPFALLARLFLTFLADLLFFCLLQNFRTILELICDAFFKHGEKDALRSCIKAITFCSCESQADLQDFAQNKLTELENELVTKLKIAMKEVAVRGRYLLLCFGLINEYAIM